MFAANFEFAHAVKIDLPPIRARHIRVHGVSTEWITLQLEILGSVQDGKATSFRDTDAHLNFSFHV